jgi:hypothetical protein
MLLPTDGEPESPSTSHNFELRVENLDQRASACARWTLSPLAGDKKRKATRWMPSWPE